VKVSSKTGLSFGSLIEFKLFDNFDLLSAMGYIQKGVNLSPLYDPYGKSIADSKEEQRLDYFDLALFFKANLYQNIFKPFLFIGPNLGYKLKAEGNKIYSGDNSIFNSKTDYASVISSTDFSIDFGIGFDYELSYKYLLSGTISYSMGLTDINRNSEIIKKTSGFQILLGLKFNPFAMKEEKLPIIILPDTVKIAEFIQEKRIDTIPKVDTIPEKKEVTEIIKEFDPAEYNVPIFITGYYRPITRQNIDELYKLLKNKLKEASYIEQFPKNSQRYKQYQNWATEMEQIFKQFYNECIDSIFPNFNRLSKPSDTLEIRILGYADPRPLNGKYVENDTIEFEDTNSAKVRLTKGEPLTNLGLSGLRAWYAGKYLDVLFSKSYLEGKTDYFLLKKSNRIVYKYIGADVAVNGNTIESQRRIRILFIKRYPH
jgi:hypothetical protein